MVAARLTLDPAGNMTTVPKPSSLANGFTLKYDAWNRLVEIRDGGNLAARYDGLNRRTVTARYITGNPSNYNHRYYNASWQMVETRVYDSSGQPETAQPRYQYVWSARYIDSPVLRDWNSDEDGLCDDQRLYYLGDANFNVTTLVDTSGDAREHYQYEPYGKVTILNGATPDTDGAEWTADPNNISDVYNQILYTGRRYDPETGLYYYRNRYYHAQLGRFVSRDPIGYEGEDENLYRYVFDRPTTLTDPSGEGVIIFIIDWIKKERARRKACRQAMKDMAYIVRGAFGVTFCKDEKPLHCVNPKKVKEKYSNARAIGIISTCILRHEVEHGKHRECANPDPKDCMKGYEAKPRYKKGFEKKEKRECDAYTVQLGCLKGFEEWCGGDAACKEEIEKEKDRVEEWRKKYCGMLSEEKK